MSSAYIHYSYIRIYSYFQQGWIPQKTIINRAKNFHNDTSNQFIFDLILSSNDFFGVGVGLSGYRLHEEIKKSM